MTTGTVSEDAMVTVTGKPALVPPEFVAESETVKVPATVGVPLITPLGPSNARPEGKPLAVKAVGELVAADAYVNATPTRP